MSNAPNSRSYRHPKHEQAAAGVRRGLSDPKVAQLLGMGRKAVARVRRLEGVAPYTNVMPEADNVARYSRLDESGHTHWNGVRSSRGVPQVGNGRDGYTSVSHVVFRSSYGRDPLGHVKVACSMKHCLTPGHLTDELMRREQGLKLRALHGWYGHWDTCPVCGADWPTAGRVGSDLRVYCKACSVARNAQHKGAAA